MLAGSMQEYYVSGQKINVLWIKSQIWVALILNLLFTVLHKMIKGAEDFSTMVSLAAKNLCSYVNLVMFLKTPQTYCNALYKKEIRNIQLDMFRNSGGG